MRVDISQCCDGFTLWIVDVDDVVVEKFHFDQEDSLEELITFFERIGVEAQYEVEC